MNWLDSVRINLLNKDLDGLWERQRAISDNIANYETPGYKAKTVSFEEELQKQLESGKKTSREIVADIRGVRPLTETLADETFRADGNGVDIDKENIELVRTTLNYYLAQRAVSDDFARLRTAIKGGA